MRNLEQYEVLLNELQDDLTKAVRRTFEDIQKYGEPERAYVEDVKAEYIEKFKEYFNSRSKSRKNPGMAKSLVTEFVANFMANIR